MSSTRVILRGTRVVQAVSDLSTSFPWSEFLTTAHYTDRIDTRPLFAILFRYREDASNLPALVTHERPLP